MIVVSDTSPLTALLTVGAAEILPSLFGEVIIPEAVRDELLHTHSSLPEWVRVVAVKNVAETQRLSRSADLGEAEAIELAKELHADRLLIDERKGRRLATQEGITIIGLLGVVLLAKKKQLIPSARALLQTLDQVAGMYLAENVREAALKTIGE